MFQAGEEGVTSDLLPLIMAVAGEGRIEEEIYLTSFLWEEAKHVEFFRRWLDDVAVARGDLEHYLTLSYRQLFLIELPSALNALKTDPSVETQIRSRAAERDPPHRARRKPAHPLWSFSP